MTQEIGVYLLCNTFEENFSNSLRVGGYMGTSLSVLQLRCRTETIG